MLLLVNFLLFDEKEVVLNWKLAYEFSIEISITEIKIKF